MKISWLKVIILITASMLACNPKKKTKKQHGVSLVWIDFSRLFVPSTSDRYVGYHEGLLEDYGYDG